MKQMLIRFLRLERRDGVTPCVMLIVPKVVYRVGWFYAVYSVLVQFSISIIATFIDDMVGFIVTQVNN